MIHVGTNLKSLTISSHRHGNLELGLPYLDILLQANYITQLCITNCFLDGMSQFVCFGLILTVNDNYFNSQEDLIINIQKLINLLESFPSCSCVL